MDEKIFWYWLSNLPEISNDNYKRLIHIFKHPSEIYRQRNNTMLWEKIQGRLNSRFLSDVRKEISLMKLSEEISNLENQGIHFVSRDDEKYPNRMRILDEMPYFLYYRGNLPEDTKPSIAIIGTRKCSEYGAQAASYFAEHLASSGIQIISGLARGIDGQAHRGTLKVDGKTFGILGSGIDICYPGENIDIYTKMQKKGGVISEYCPGQKGLPYRFPQRNRIISALSDAVFVIEAGEKSGTLITVSYGLEQGKDIYALPGKVTDRQSRGCNSLIKDGAAIITCVDDIYHELSLKYADYQFGKDQTTDMCYQKKNNKLLASDEKIVYSVLSLEPKHLEKLLNITKMNVSRLLEALTGLEIKGLIYQPSKDYYVINIS